jgi:serine protease SohB
MDFLVETLSFATKGFIVFLTVVAVVAAVVALTRRSGRFQAHLDVKPLNPRFEALGDALRYTVLDKKALKAVFKERKVAHSDSAASKKNIYVLDFDGDLLASQVTSLREEISAIAAVVRPADEVVIRLESPGGAVPHYGLAAAQLARLRDKKITLTVCVDRIAASGGYMMACVADKIVAAPFAIIGSIGVVAQVPNFHRLLQKNDIDFEEMTAGQFKRTVSLFGKISPTGKEKFSQQLEETHGLFKDFVKSQRPSLDVEKVATGEYWLARRAQELGLVDQLSTSDEYLLSRLNDANLFQVHFSPEQNWRTRFTRAAAQVVERALLAVGSRLQMFQLR